MFRAYFRYRSLHQLLALLEVAIAKASPPDAQRLRDRFGTIDDLCGTGAALAGSVQIAAIQREVLSQVRLALAPSVPR